MKTLKFKNENETADMVIRLEMACSRFTVTGRTEIMVEDNEPALVLPPTFVAHLRRAVAERGLLLTGAAKRKDSFNILVSGKTVRMKGSFSVNDVMEKL